MYSSREQLTNSKRRVNRMKPLDQLQAQSERVFLQARMGLITEEQKRHRLAQLANGVFTASVRRGDIP